MIVLRHVTTSWAVAHQRWVARCSICVPTLQRETSYLLVFQVKMFKHLGILFIMKLYTWISTFTKIILKLLYFKETVIFERGVL